MLDFFQRKSKIFQIGRLLLAFFLLSGWFFAGWPRIGNFPPKIERAQAAVSFVGSTEGGSNPNTDTTVDISTLGLQEGDLVIVAASIGDNDNTDLNMTINTAGFDTHEVADLFSDDTQEVNLGVWWKIMGASPDTSVVIEGNVGGGTDSSLAAVVMAFRGVDTTTPMDVTPTTASGANQGTMHPDPPSIDHNNPSGVWTVIVGASGHALAGTGTYTFPTGYTTNAIDHGTDDTSDTTVGMGYRSSGVADPENPGVMTHSGTNSANYAWAAVTMALRPLPPPPVDTPAFNNGTGTYNNDVSVTITVTNPAGSTICYTTDGSTPAANTPGTCSTGTTYSGPVSITATATTLKAIGTKSGYTNSGVQSATYTLTVGVVSSSPGPGTYTSAQDVTLNIATTTGATAHYTTDGSAVSCSSTSYSGAFNIATTSTVKAIGCKTNYNSSAPISDLYTINLNTPPSLSISEPNGTSDYVTVGNPYTITYSLSDPDNVVTAAFYYDTDQDKSGGTGIYGDCASAPETSTTCAWDTTGVTPGSYYVYGLTDDGSGPVSAISSGQVTIENPATTFLIGGTETGTKNTAVTTVTFPEGAAGATISAPYNNVDGSGDPQVLSLGPSEPVVKIKNTHGTNTYNLTLEITTWTNSLVDMEYYNLVPEGIPSIQTVTSDLSNANGAAKTVDTGISVVAGAFKDLYLKLVLGSVSGKTGASTLSVLGELP